MSSRCSQPNVTKVHWLPKCPRDVASQTSQNCTGCLIVLEIKPSKRHKSALAAKMSSRGSQPNVTKVHWLPKCPRNVASQTSQKCIGCLNVLEMQPAKRHKSTLAA